MQNDFENEKNESQFNKMVNILSFEPVNDIFNVMNAAIGNKHCAIIKIVKKLDFDLMIKAMPQKFCDSTALSDICINVLS